jgi:CRP-like cAMP-binding protein
MLSEPSRPARGQPDGPADTSAGEAARGFPLERILAHGHPLRLFDGDVLPTAAACRVEEGRIGVGLDGTEPSIVHLLGPGAWFRVEAEPRRLVHRAVGAARVSRVERAQLQAALPDAVAAVELAMLEIERDRILALTAALLVADPLQRLAMRLAALCADVGAAHLDLTQADLAAMAALSRHTVNRALARLETDGIVVNRYRRIEVSDLQALRAVADRKRRGRRQASAD